MISENGVFGVNILTTPPPPTTESGLVIVLNHFSLPTMSKS